MDKIVVQKGAKLDGEVAASGAKNSSLPLLFSTLLADGEHKLHNVPILKDIDSTFRLLELLNCKTQREGHTAIVTVSESKQREAEYDIVRKMRASILCLGPLLARYGEAVVSLPGGCAIGTRPINQHLDALKQLGAEFEIKGGNVHGRVKKLTGGNIVFDGVTVGGTENILMAAVLADGETVIENAAKEPEIVDLCEYLNKMGAKISNVGSSVLKIEGVKSLSPSEHTVIPDRIEAGTLLIAGAITGGDVKVTHCVPKHFEALTNKMREAGFEFVESENSIRVLPTSSFQGVDVTTAPHPGFATDFQAQFMALMTQAKGSSIITESIFENRFMHVQELRRLNADITPKSRVAIVRGPCALQGAPVMATDLRASASLILAGLFADGETTISRVYHLDRGYEKLEEKLANLGANVRRD